MDSGQKVFPKSVATATHSWRININRTAKYRRRKHLTSKKYLINYNTFLQWCRSNAATSTSLSKLLTSKMVVRILLIPRAFNFHHPLLNMAALIQGKEIILSSEWHSYMDSQEILRLEYMTHFHEGLSTWLVTATIRKAAPRNADPPALYQALLPFPNVL